MFRSLILLSFLFYGFYLQNGASLDFFSSFNGGGPFGGGSSGSRSDTCLYDRLGLDKTATTAEIKKSYHRRAMTTHPDKGGDTEKFKALNEAYEILGDAEKRAKYDRFGMAAFEDGNFGTGGSSADTAREFFRGFGGGGGPFGGNPFAQAFNMPVILQVDLSLEDLFLGKEMSVQLDSSRFGRGTIVKLNIRPGMIGGQELLVRNEQFDREIIFRIEELRHPLFRRKNADLLVDLGISLREALLGFERPLKHIDGKEIWIRSKKGDIINFDDVLVIPGQGMPVYGQPDVRGRLFVRCNVKLPKKMWLSEEKMVALDGILPPEDSAMSKLRARATQRARTGMPAYTLKRGELGDFGRYGVVEGEEDPFGRGSFNSFFYR